ncbi:Cytochrome c oxidase-assembly factor COX23 [Fusarium oxysporum f. sp. albedinis]|nr:Cytochrome c oxidase-assembly factor COX23 [Fusarium oxysporum f. sp. albedinis]
MRECTAIVSGHIPLSTMEIRRRFYLCSRSSRASRVLGWLRVFRHIQGRLRENGYLKALAIKFLSDTIWTLFQESSYISKRPNKSRTVMDRGLIQAR